MALCVSCGQKYGSKGYPQRNAAHVRWTLPVTSSGWKSSARVVPTATKRILLRRFPGTCETVGQVLKFVWSLCWKINVVCMSLSQFDSFQSRFQTYLLNRPSIKKLLNIKECVLICPTTYVWNISHSKKNWESTIINLHTSSCKVAGILVILVFQWDLNFLNRLSTNTHIPNSIKIRPVGTKIFMRMERTDGQTDRSTDGQKWRS